MTNLEKSWLAGFWEGEGYVGCFKSRRHRLNGYSEYNSKKWYYYWTFTLTIAQKNRKILEWIKSKYKGKIYYSKTRNSFWWTWHVHRQKAKRFLLDILPYLKTPHKTKQAINALKLYNKKVTQNVNMS